MAPGTIQSDTPVAANGTTLKPTARAFHPTGTPNPARYHAESSQDAITAEAKFAAHNYHPLPIGTHACTGKSGHQLTTDSFLARKRLLSMGSRGQALSRLPLRLQRRQPGPLPPRTCESFDRAGLKADAQ